MKKSLKTNTLVLCFVVGLGASAFALREAAENNAIPVVADDAAPRSIETTRISLSDIDEKYTYSGKIVPSDEVMVTGVLSGKVTGAYYDVGDYVSAGTILYSLDKDDILDSIDTLYASLASANVGIKTAQTSVESALAGVETAQSNVDSAIAGLEAAEKGIASLDININSAELAINSTELTINSADLTIESAEVSLNSAEVTINSSDLNIKAAELSVQTARNNIELANGASVQMQVESSKAGVSNAQIAYDNAKLNFDNVTILYNQGIVSKTDYDQAKMGLDQSSVALSQAQASLSLIENNMFSENTQRANEALEQAIVQKDTVVNQKEAAINQRDAAAIQRDGAIIQKDTAIVQRDSAINQRDAAVAQRETTLAQLEMNRAQIKTAEAQKNAAVAQVASAQAQVESAQAQRDSINLQIEQARGKLNDADVRTPLSGIISSKNIKTGEIVSAAGGAPYVVINTNTIDIAVNVAETIVNAIHVGDNVDVKISAASDEPFYGRVSNINPTSNSDGTFEVKIQVDNSSNSLKVGMLGDVTFTKNAKKGVIVIPRAAVVSEGSMNYVFLEYEGTVLKTEVELGIESNNNVEILSGVDRGANIVITGQTFVSDKEAVTVTVVELSEEE